MIFGEGKVLKVSQISQEEDSQSSPRKNGGMTISNGRVILEHHTEKSTLFAKLRVLIQRREDLKYAVETFGGIFRLEKILRNF